LPSHRWQSAGDLDLHVSSDFSGITVCVAALVRPLRCLFIYFFFFFYAPWPASRTRHVSAVCCPPQTTCPSEATCSANDSTMPDALGHGVKLKKKGFFLGGGVGQKPPPPRKKFSPPLGRWLIKRQQPDAAVFGHRRGVGAVQPWSHCDRHGDCSSGAHVRRSSPALQKPLRVTRDEVTVRFTKGSTIVASVRDMVIPIYHKAPPPPRCFGGGGDQKKVDSSP